MTFSRRDFFKAAGIGLGALVYNAIKGDNLVNALEVKSLSPIFPGKHIYEVLKPGSYSTMMGGQSFYAGRIEKIWKDSKGQTTQLLNVNLCQDKGCPKTLILGGPMGGPIDGEIYGYDRRVVSNPQFNPHVEEDIDTNPKTLVRFFDINAMAQPIKAR